MHDLAAFVPNTTALFDVRYLNAELEEESDDAMEHDQRFSCYVCSRRFVSRQPLRIHLRTHAKVDFVCPVEGCDRVYRNKGKLREHKRVAHGQVEKVSCPECGETFKRWYRLDRHRKKTHPSKEPKEPRELKFSCSVPNCDKKYTLFGQLRQHAREAHRLLLPHSMTPAPIDATVSSSSSRQPFQWRAPKLPTDTWCADFKWLTIDGEFEERRDQEYSAGTLVSILEDASESVVAEQYKSAASQKLKQKQHSSTPLPATMFKAATFVFAVIAISATHATCSDGQEEISVQGIDGYFCVDGESCSGTNDVGLCPGDQDGLEFGSYCDLLKTGVYGCKPYADWDSPSSAEYDAPLNCTGNIAGEFPVSVEDGDGTFCSASPVCSGTIAGNCPGVQEGLPSGSVCVVIETGVYGCVLPPVV